MSPETTHRHFHEELSRVKVRLLTMSAKQRAALSWAWSPAGAGQDKRPR